MEATKFTEVGFHGRDVDSIVRDLIDAAAALVRGKLKDKATQKVSTRALPCAFSFLTFCNAVPLRWCAQAEGQSHTKGGHTRGSDF